MIYKFKSKAAGDVIMLGPSGDRILSLLGREPAAKGIIEVADMARAIAVLEQAVAAEEAELAAQAADAAPDAPPSRREGVSLRQRAWPLLEMLRRSLRAQHPVMWGV